MSAMSAGLLAENLADAIDWAADAAAYMAVPADAALARAGISRADVNVATRALANAIADARFAATNRALADGRPHARAKASGVLFSHIDRAGAAARTIAGYADRIASGGVLAGNMRSVVRALELARSEAMSLVSVIESAAPAIFPALDSVTVRTVNPAPDRASTMRPGLESMQRRSTAASARRLLKVATRMVPPGDRARYGEEFQSELADIARAEGGRWGQLAYAIRQVMSSVRLRAVLRSPRRRSAVP